MKRKIIVLLMILLGVCLSGCARISPEEAIKETHNPVETTQVESLAQSNTPLPQKEEREAMIGELMSDDEGFDTYLSPDERYICGIAAEMGHLVVLNEKNEVVFDQTIKIQEEDLRLWFNGWSDDNKWLWITHQHTFFVDYFSLINLETGNVTHFEQNYGFQSDYALNPNNGYLCFSTIPHFLDIDTKEEFQAIDHEIPLYLVNLFGDESTPEKVLDSSINRAFQPIWIDEYTVEYNAPYTVPDEIERLFYSFNQSYKPAIALEQAPTQTVLQTNEEKVQRILEVLKDEKLATTETIDLYGYKIPIWFLDLYEDNDKVYSEASYISWGGDWEYLYVPTDDRREEDISKLAEFLGFKYAEETVDWLMDKFKNGNGMIEFTDGTYLLFSNTTAGFRGVSCGYIKDRKSI